MRKLLRIMLSINILCGILIAARYIGTSLDIKYSFEGLLYEMNKSSLVNDLNSFIATTFIIVFVVVVINICLIAISLGKLKNTK